MSFLVPTISWSDEGSADTELQYLYVQLLRVIFGMSAQPSGVRDQIRSHQYDVMQQDSKGKV